MTQKRLPARADLAQLKKQAKELVRAAARGEAEQQERFRILPGGEVRREYALHDAQAVIAREHGYRSWNALREEVEDRELTLSAAADEFVRCATGGAAERAGRLWERFPAIGHANLACELVRGDIAAVEERLRRRPELAATSGGVQNWEPLLYVCHTGLGKGHPERLAGLVRIATLLLERGANPNATYSWNWHRELPRTALWGALCTVRHLPLAEVLLAHGAEPTDGVTLHICAGGGNREGLELLGRYGVQPDGIAGGVPPLRYILGWATAEEGLVGIRWLLENGASPNLAWAETGDAPLHIVAERWDASIADLLAQYGLDVTQRRADGRTALTIAELHGNRTVAAWLRERGVADEMTPLERFVAACARGDRPGAESLLGQDPALRDALGPEEHGKLHGAAERGDAGVLDTMLACGFDPNTRDRDGVTPLHRAALAGQAEAARILLAHGADVAALDGMFAASPLVWAAEGWRHSEQRWDGPHVAAARLLLAAGSPTDWVVPEKAPDAEGSLETLAELCRAAAG